MKQKKHIPHQILLNILQFQNGVKDGYGKKYQKKSRYAPNGIDFQNITNHKRDLNHKKIRILIEGDCKSYIKNVDESFKIIERIDRNKFEVWYLSYNSVSKNWYKFDKFLKEIPRENIYQMS